MISSFGILTMLTLGFLIGSGYEYAPTAPLPRFVARFRDSACTLTHVDRSVTLRGKDGPGRSIEEGVQVGDGAVSGPTEGTRSDVEGEGG